MKQKVNQLIREYREGKLRRREFIKQLSLVTGTTLTASGVLPLLAKESGKDPLLKGLDDELHTGFIEYPTDSGKMRAYLSHPKNGRKLPAVIVIHENKGLQPHIRDVNRRMAKEGFLAIAPDALTPLGGTPGDDVDGARSKMRELDREDTRKNFVAAVKYLETHPLTNGNVGCTGFCWGGGMTNQVAVHSPELDAAVPYYGRQPDPEDVPEIKAAVMAHYAGDDERINAGIEAFEAAMKKAGIEYRIFIYEGARHAFNNDSNPDRYHEKSARLAWKRTVEFFKEKLG